jgi:hypothetical protein
MPIVAKELRRLPLLGNGLVNVPAAIDMHTTIEELLEAVFSMQSIMKEDQQDSKNVTSLTVNCKELKEFV